MSSQPLAGPKFVDARNHRYLPLASHAGLRASDMPSVIWIFCPVSTLYAMIAWNIEGSCFAYAIQRPLGEKRGTSARGGHLEGLVSTCVCFPVATSITHRRRWVS